MLHRLSFAALMFVILANSLEGKLPDFIKTCRVSDPEFNECIYEHAKQAVPHLVKGVPELNIPSFAKIKLPSLKTPSGESYAFTFDGDLEGLADTDYKYLKFEFETQKGKARVYLPQLKLVGKYSISGTIADKEINGEGDASIILSDAFYNYEYNLGTFDKDGVTYYKGENLVLTAYEAESAKYNFNNLSGGESAKGTEMNDILNDNWKILYKDLGRILAQNVVKIFLAVVDKVLETTPSKEIFLP